MLHNRLLLLFLFCTTNIFAQSLRDAPVKDPSTTSPKATKKQDDANSSETDYKQVGAPMPPVKLRVYYDTSLESGKKQNKKEFLTNADVDNGANLFLMMFNPTCSHCMDETIMLEKNIFLFKRSKIVLMANPTMTPYMPDFYKLLNMSEYPSINIGYDDANTISKLFLYQPLPQINIYNGDRKLIKIFTGEVIMDSLKTYIQ